MLCPTHIGQLIMKKKLFYSAFILMLFSLGSSTFTSCGKDDDDDAVSRIDTIYMVSKDTVYINNGSTNSADLGVFTMGWVDLTVKDLNGKVVSQVKASQTIDRWGDGYFDIDTGTSGGITLNINGVRRGCSSLSKGSYAIEDYYESSSKKELGGLDFYYSYPSLGTLYPLENQKHNITKVEKVGQFIDGNYIYAIEGNFDIKLKKKENSTEASYTAKCSYRIIVESNYYAEKD